MTAPMLAAALLFGAPAPKDERKPAKEPLGEWTIERLEFSGREIETSAYHSVSIAVDTVSLLMGGYRSSSESATFFVPDRGKAEVDYFPNDPKNLRKGIWNLDGDTLTICDAGRGVERPTEFTAPEGSKRSLWVLKRVPKK